MSPERVVAIRDAAKRGHRWGKERVVNDDAIRLCDTVDDLREQLREAREDLYRNTGYE